MTGCEKLCDWLHSIRCNCRNRFVTKPHLIKTGFKAGAWVEYDTRILHGCFQVLVEFVENETIANLEWQSKLTYGADYGIPVEDDEYGAPSTHAIFAKEVLDLYYFWTRDRHATQATSGQRCDEGDYEGSIKIYEKLAKDEQLNLMRLIAIRESLWN